MKLQKFAIARFVKRWLKRFRNCIKRRIYFQSKPAPLSNPFPYEYTYYTFLTPDCILTARVIRNGKPYCMYSSPKTFKPLGNFEISEKEKDLMLNDLKAGKKIEGLTFLHENPDSNPTLKEDIHNSIFKLKLSSKCS